MSLCPWSIQVTLGHGFRYEIPALPALDWLQYLLSNDPDLDGLIADLMPGIEDYFLDNDQSPADMYETALEIISIASARSWWIAIRLIFSAALNWHIIGPKLIMSQIDASKISLAAWLDVVLFMMIDIMDPKKVIMFTSQLEAPPTGVLSAAEIEAAEPTMDRSSFLAMAG